MTVNPDGAEISTNGIVITNERTELVLLPSLKAMRGARGGLILTEKYLNGVAMFAKNWPGLVTSLVDLDTIPTSDMDRVEVMPSESETNIELRPQTIGGLAARLDSAAVVLIFLSSYERPTTQLCQRIGLPVVFISEYSLKTECQIVRSNTRNPILIWRRQLWHRWSEKVRIEMLKMAAGLQCSGTPSYDSYQGLTPRNLLFFDNRVPEGKVISKDDFARKTNEMAAKRPLRLVFGGRLIPMKGVQDLVQFANVMRAREVPFKLDIYGSGPLEAELETDIRKFDLADHVRLRGVRDFETSWVPMLKRDVDLFICCHPQGDPSCTYPEVMSCGVPIAGYANEALCGIVAHSNGGWVSPIHDINKLVDRVEYLHENRAVLISTATDARAFALKHSFEMTMAKRSNHLIEVSRLPELLKTKKL